MTRLTLCMISALAFSGTALAQEPTHGPSYAPPYCEDCQSGPGTGDPTAPAPPPTGFEQPPPYAMPEPQLAPTPRYRSSFRGSRHMPPPGYPDTCPWPPPPGYIWPPAPGMIVQDCG
jgi:hypothetical protein